MVLDGINFTRTWASGTFNPSFLRLDYLPFIPQTLHPALCYTLSRQHSTAGPGAYNASGMGSESMRKAYLESTRKGVFGTTSTRTQPIMRREDLELPGPAHYQPKEKPFKPRYVQPTANFSSVTNRLVEPPNTVKVSSLEILLGRSGRVLLFGWLVGGWFVG